MIRSEAIAEIKAGTGFRVNLDTTIIRALDAAQRQLELGKTLPWFLIAYDELLSFVVNTPGIVALPDNFLRLHDEYDPYYLDPVTTTKRISIPRKNYTEAYAAYGNEDDASEAVRPKVFVIRTRDNFLFYPNPTEDFDFYLTYYAKDDLPSTLAADGTNLWLTHAPEVIIGEAGLRVASQVRDKEAVQLFAGRRDAGNRALMGEIIEQELAGRPLVMGRNQ